MPVLLKLLQYFLVGNAQRVVELQLAIAAIFGFAGFVLWRACEDAIRVQSVYEIQPKDIRVFDAPIWVSDKFIQEALDYRPSEKRKKTLNALDPNLKSETLAAFGSHPWVEKVEKIVVYYPGKIDLTIQFKKPVAVVDPTPLADEDFAAPESFVDDLGDPNSDSDFEEKRSRSAEKYVVDKNGYRLPDAYFKEHPNAYCDLMKILGVYSTPVSGYGDCVDPMVGEAAALADFLLRYDAAKKLGIDRVFVSKEKGAAKGKYALKSKNNLVLIRWGRFYVRSNPGDATNPANFDVSADENPKNFERQKEKIKFLLEKADEEYWLDDRPDGPKREVDLEKEFPEAEADDERPPTAR